MQTPSVSVKSAFYLMCVIWLLPVLVFARALKPLEVEKTLAEHFEPQSHYVAQNLRYAPFEQLRQQVESRLKIELKNRGEAHITVITPPEWTLLSQKLQMSEVNAWAEAAALHHSPYVPLCVGRFHKGHQSTYYVVVESPALLEFREKLRAEFTKRGGTGDFEPTHFKPHITLGFTARDLHEQDGAVKDASSCWMRWN